MRFKAFAHGVRRAVFELSLQFLLEFGGASGGFFAAMAERKNLFKLIEHDHGREQTIARPPEINVDAVKIFPESFAVRRARPLDLGAIEFGSHGQRDLARKRSSVVAVIEAHAERKEIQFLQPREQAGLKQRSLAEARLAIEHDHRRALNQAE